MHPYSRKPSAHRADSSDAAREVTASVSGGGRCTCTRENHPPTAQSVATSLLPTRGAVGSRQTHPNLECRCIDPRLSGGTCPLRQYDPTLPPCRGGLLEVPSNLDQRWIDPRLSGRS